MAHKQEELDFQEYLKQIEAGQPVEKILAGAPEEAHVLRATLEAADWLHQRQHLVVPRLGLVAASRKRLMARLQEPAARQPGGWRSRWLAYTWSRSPGLAHSPVVMAVLLVLLVGMFFHSSSALVRSSPTWLPGDFFYPLKTTGEDLSLLASLSAEQRASRHIEFARLRLIESQALVLEGRYEEIAGTVADFSYHVDGAVRTINQISRYDLESARQLAGILHVTLSQQNQLIAILAQICPTSAGQDLQRVLSIAQNGLSAVKQIIEPNSGSTEILAWYAPQLALAPQSVPRQQDLLAPGARRAGRLAFL